MSSVAQPASSRQQLLAQVRSVLPPEAMQYVQALNDHRFGRHPGADQMFFSPTNLLSLLTRLAVERGGLDGDDRDRLIAEGVSPDAFELPGNYQYLTVSAEGRAGLLSLDELPHWLPVTLRAELQPENRIGFRRAVPRNQNLHLLFTIDADFQRPINYATVIIAPNWFADPSSPRAVLDAFLGPPVPSGLQSVAVDDPLAVTNDWQDGTEMPAHQLRKIVGDRPVWVCCRNRNLPGT